LAASRRGQVLASAGCDAVNAGGFYDNVSNPTGSIKTIANFAVSDKVTFTITIAGFGNWTLRTGYNSTLDSQVNSATWSYTVTGTNSDTTLQQTILPL
jgi:hypothetical protein